MAKKNVIKGEPKSKRKPKEFDEDAVAFPLYFAVEKLKSLSVMLDHVDDKDPPVPVNGLGIILDEIVESLAKALKVFDRRQAGS